MLLSVTAILVSFIGQCHTYEKVNLQLDRNDYLPQQTYLLLLLYYHKLRLLHNTFDCCESDHMLKVIDDVCRPTMSCDRIPVRCFGLPRAH